MRVRLVFTAIAVMAAAPGWAQSKPALAPRTTLPAHVMCADLLVPAMPVAAQRIAGAHHPETRLALSRGDVAVLSRQPEDGLAVCQRYLVRRLPSGTAAVVPKDGGYVPVRTTGSLTITALDDFNAMAHIDYACDAIEPDDYIVPYSEPALPTPDVTVDGVTVGARYAIYRDGKDGKPLVHVGEAIVAELSPTSAKMVLMPATGVVNVTDIAVPRR
jgi:hypothetical protein